MSIQQPIEPPIDLEPPLGNTLTRMPWRQRIVPGEGLWPRTKILPGLHRIMRHGKEAMTLQRHDLERDL
jgi:hypothetical protein